VTKKWGNVFSNNKKEHITFASSFVKNAQTFTDMSVFFVCAHNA